MSKITSKLRNLIFRLDAEDGSTETFRQRRRAARAARQDHKLALAGLDETKILDRYARRDRKEDARERAALARIQRRAMISGENLRIAHLLASSGEMRARRLRNLRVWSLRVLMPVLLAFAAWSTVGVQKGITTLLHNSQHDGTWYGAWLVEPALIVIVAGVIVFRSVIRSVGGDLRGKATAIEFTALTFSIMLNLAGAWPTNGGLADVPTVIAHSAGPLGTAGTAVLIGIFEKAVSLTDPWKGVPSVSQLFPGERPSKTTRKPASPRPAVRPAKRTMNTAEDAVKVSEDYERALAAGEPVTVRAIADRTGVSKSAVDRYLRQYRELSTAVNGE